MGEREIRYRAKDKFTGQWVYGYPRKTALGNWILYNGDRRHCILPETIGQGTGHLDCNGKEIYEGDIVRFFDDLEDDLPDGIVRYHEDVCAFMIDNERYEPLFFSPVWEYEIINNTHELEQKSTDEM